MEYVYTPQNILSTFGGGVCVNIWNEEIKGEHLRVNILEV